ncbi:nitrite reductase [Stutzerimonas zhaodongensis]|uniref:Nitrite reductase n=1 Tax=Stutzerimonas zhaodongensis TaxID=1176257 RepID=A0A3M2HPD5_9GAMM|nr:nitrite reductase [Stutzerimonas zhaodongensis]MCQ4315537.1 nitrite reductase [Stutzerimonas zhaodongensis]RMH91591.1 nitrite reductase [Stutzerimonas zhaodongensis]
MPLLTSSHVRRYGWLSLLASIELAAPHVTAAQAFPDLVEFSAWSRSWSGTLGSKGVEVTLNRAADGLSGSYCYQPCAAETRYRLQLSGRIEGEQAVLTERNVNNPTVTTGTWHVTSFNDGIAGSWISSAGKRKLPLKLDRTQDELEVRFPFEIRLLADALPEEEGDGCPTPPVVFGIRLYKDGEPVQTLATESQGTCSLFLPELIDANFDGWPDLTIAELLPAGPNVPHQTWLYDPKTGRFVDAPSVLQGVTSAEFDPAHQMIYSYWRSSCCEHGVTTYRWQGDEVVEVDNRSSYFLPVMDGTTRRTCYIAPAYVKGFIEFPSRIEQTKDGRLTLHGIDPQSCDLDEGAFLERTYIDIWKPAQPGEQPTRLRTEESEWVKTDTSVGPRYCADVPYYDNGHIRRVVLSERTEWCSQQSPDQQ